MVYKLTYTKKSAWFIEGFLDTDFLDIRSTNLRELMESELEEIAGDVKEYHQKIELFKHNHPCLYTFRFFTRHYYDIIRPEYCGVEVLLPNSFYSKIGPWKLIKVEKLDKSRDQILEEMKIEKERLLCLGYTFSASRSTL